MRAAHRDRGSGQGIDPSILAGEADVPWVDVAGMRDRLAHRYFDTAHAIVRAIVDDDLPVLLAAVRRLQEPFGRT